MYFRIFIVMFLVGFSFLVNASSMPSLFDKTHYLPRKPFGFYKYSLDKKNILYLNGMIDFHSDAFLDTKGMVMNLGTNAINLNDQSFALRSWLFAVRPFIEAQLEKDIHIHATPDFGLQQFRFFDGLVDINYFRTFSFLGGLQKSLVSGLEVLLNSLNLNYPGYSSTLSPNREVGFIWHGAIGPQREHSYSINSYLGFDDWLSFQLGVFNGNADSSFPGIVPINVAEGPNLYQFSTFNTGNKAFEGRVFFNPFINRPGHLLYNFGIGFAGSAQTVVNQLGLPAFLSIGRNVIFSFQTYESASIAIGTRNRIHPQVVWHFKNFGILGDWAQTMQHLGLRFRSHVQNYYPDIIRQVNNSGQIQFVYNLTGEEFTLGLMHPNHHFRPLDKDEWGSFQLALRLSFLDLDPSVFESTYVNDKGQIQYNYSDPRVSVRRASSWGLALNWFWSDKFRISTEFSQTVFQGGCSSGSYLDPVSPGCLTASKEYITAPTSQVINRPDELVFLQRFLLIF